MADQQTNKKQQMTAKEKRLFGILAVIIVFLSGILFLVFEYASRETEITLPNGSVVSVTPDEKKALEKACSYIDNYLEDYNGYSHQELMEKLQRNGFSAETARFAADNCGANWNEQAAYQAGVYLVIYPNSTKDRIIDLLLYEGFTYAQALAGAQANGFY
ncbi:MAG: hypothetical protein IJX91_04670 [Clostridia bacterium]|nr:hypothetical protein [Clostridia bacterium]